MLIKLDISFEFHTFDLLLMSLAAALIGHWYGWIDIFRILSRIHGDFVKFLRSISKDDDSFAVPSG